MTKVSQLTLLTLIFFVTSAFADELTLAVEQELERLGYETGAADGDATVETTIAIAKYQAEHGYAITGEASEKLSGALAKTTSIGNAPKVHALQPDKSATVVVSEKGLNAAREACLKDKMMMSQSTWTSNHVTNEVKEQLKDQGVQAAIQASGIGMGQQIYQLFSQWESDSDSPTTSEAQDMAASLGITEDDINACQRPSY